MAHKRPPPTPVFVLRGSEAPVYSVGFSGDGTSLASGSGDGSLMFWDVQSRRCVLRIKDAHQKAINRVVWDSSPSPVMVWSQGRDGLLKCWDVEAQQCLSGHHVGCEGFVPMSVQGSVAALPDPNDSRGVVALKLAPNNVTVMHQWTVPQTYGMCMRLCVGPDGGYIFAVYEGGQMAVFNVVSGSMVWEGNAPLGMWNESKATCTAVCLDPAGKKGVVGSNGCTMAPFTFDGAHVVWDDPVVNVPRPGVSDLVYRRSDARMFAAAGWDGKVRVWSGKQGHKPICVCDFHAGIAHCVDFDLKANMMAVGAQDTKISLWNI